MPTIYIKRPDELEVCSLRGRDPQIPKWAIQEKWTQIDPKEFRRLKARIKRGNHRVRTIIELEENHAN
jgi:hypothetical protein